MNLEEVEKIKSLGEEEKLIMTKNELSRKLSENMEIYS